MHLSHRQPSIAHVVTDDLWRSISDAAIGAIVLGRTRIITAAAGLILTLTLMSLGIFSIAAHWYAT